jgi:hypothetical protein
MSRTFKDQRNFVRKHEQWKQRSIEKYQKFITQSDEDYQQETQSGN